jgi:hypothetical protein
MSQKLHVVTAENLEEQVYKAIITAASKSINQSLNHIP